MNSYRNLYYSILVACGSGLAAVFLGAPQNTKLALTGLAFLALVLSCFVAARLLIEADSRASRKSLLAAAFVVVGGTVADVSLTLWNSPDLQQEANPIALLLLGAGVEVRWVLAFGLTAQALLAAFAMILFALFLSSYENLLARITANGFVDFTAQVYGGPGKNWADIFLGRSDPRYAIVFSSPLLVAVYLYRWYLAAEWAGLVPISRVVVPSVIVASAFVGLSFVYKAQAARIKAL